jgi:hypothetical protein
MATCFILVESVLTATADAVDLCTGYILQSSIEHQSNITINTLFSVPADVSQLTFIFTGFFMLPLFGYLSAWLWGVILDFIGKDH